NFCGYILHFSDKLVGNEVHFFVGIVECKYGKTVCCGFKFHMSHKIYPVFLARYTRSIMVAVPRPFAAQSVMRPVDLSVRSSSSSTVPVIIAPVAPSGWPIAIAPPQTLTLSCGILSCFM